MKDEHLVKKLQNLANPPFLETPKHFGPVKPPGVLPYMGYIGMCGPKGYGFSAVLVINRVSILADFGYFGHK